MEPSDISAASLTEQVLCDNATRWPHSRFSARDPGWPPPRMGKVKNGGECNRVRHEICARTPSRLISFLRQLDGTDGEASNETAETP
jgi:hypothetical protein